MVTEGVFTPAHVLAEAIQRREVSSLEVVEAYLTQIARHNPDLNAVVTLGEDGARMRAREADAALTRGEEWGPLHGLPITLEDAHSTSGMRTTWGGLPRMADYVPEEDGTVAARLKAAGAILLGKTNGPEIWPDSIFARTSNPEPRAYAGRLERRCRRRARSGPDVSRRRPGYAGLDPEPGALLWRLRDAPYGAPRSLEWSVHPRSGPQVPRDVGRRPHGAQR